MLAPNGLSREFSRLQGGLDALLKGGGPFEAQHDLEERSSAIWLQEELTISIGLCSVDVARAVRFDENIKHQCPRRLWPKPPDNRPSKRLHDPRALELAHIDERIENRERLNSIGNAPDDVKTDRPPYVVNHQMKISDACRVDGFEIPRGQPAPAVIEIGRPIGKTQSRQINSDPLKPAAGQFRKKLRTRSVIIADSIQGLRTVGSILPEHHEVARLQYRVANDLRPRRGRDLVRGTLKPSFLAFTRKNAGKEFLVCTGS